MAASDQSDPPDQLDLLERPVVSNTSPLITLVGLGLLDLLPALYGTVWVPEAVSKEYAAGKRIGEPSLDELAWVKMAQTVVVRTELPPSLGRGEAEAISLAIVQDARAILLDERLARRIARESGLPVVGTLGVLVAAKQSGLLAAVKPVLDIMMAQGRHISDNLYMQVLAAVGEKS